MLLSVVEDLLYLLFFLFLIFFILKDNLLDFLKVAHLVVSPTHFAIFYLDMILFVHKFIRITKTYMLKNNFSLKTDFVNILMWLNYY